MIIDKGDYERLKYVAKKLDNIEFDLWDELWLIINNIKEDPNEKEY